MRIIVTISILISGIVATYGQKNKIEEEFININLKQIKNGISIDYDFLKQTSGKVTVIEFWETWCGPCIEGMHHLKELKSKFPNSLEIVCVSKGVKKKTVNFINNNEFDFIFIHDSLKQVADIFPHTSIPYTILIDSKGQIQAKTSPLYITENTINKILQNKPINLPRKYVPENQRNTVKPDNNSLVSFKLERHKLGEPTKTENRYKKVPVQIVTGYSGNAYKDTVEIIRRYELKGKNILELYQYTFNNYPLTRFKFDKSIDYINSKLPNHLYNLEFSASSFLGYSKGLLKKQLNAVFDLSIEQKKIDTTILRISSIDTTNISIGYTSNAKGGSSKTYENKGNIEFVLKATNISTLDIARTIEDKINMPVIFDNSLNRQFNLDILINEYDQDLDVWLKHFKEKGIILEKDIVNIEFIKIEKAAHNTPL